MTKEVINEINLVVLRQCREQIGLSVEEVRKKFPRIDKFESGEAKPTYKQLSDMAELYVVPQWVFLKSELPDEYKLETNSAFRKLVRTSEFEPYQIRRLLTKIECFRELIIDFRNDINEPIHSFSPPSVENVVSTVDVAKIVRKWLGCSDSDKYDFDEWRAIIESKGVFVFLTSKFSTWSKVDVSLFRGMAIYKEILPIIVINDSDAYKAQVFTLFHELGHLIKKQIALDSTYFDDDSVEEVWCNDFAGNVLMPYSKFQNISPPPKDPEKAIEQVQSNAEQFAVSPLACLVRMRKLELIDEEQFKEIISIFDKKNSAYKESQGGSNYVRNMADERIQQYGSLYTSVVVDAYYAQEISLHRMCKLLELKRPQQALELAKKL